MSSHDWASRGAVMDGKAPFSDLEDAAWSGIVCFLKLHARRRKPHLRNLELSILRCVLVFGQSSGCGLSLSGVGRGCGMRMLAEIVFLARCALGSHALPSGEEWTHTHAVGRRRWNVGGHLSDLRAQGTLKAN